MPIRSWMSSIMGQIEPEHPELFALEQNLATIYMPIRSQMNSIMGQNEPEHPELFALEFGKIAEYDFVYTLASTNINQSAPNLVQMYKTIRAWMSLIMELIRPELFELSTLEYENLPYLTLFTF